MRIKGLTEKQLVEAKGLYGGDTIVRFTVDGQSVASVVSGDLHSRGINVIHMTHYWDATREWIKYVKESLELNNPGITVHVHK